MGQKKQKSSIQASLLTQDLASAGGVVGGAPVQCGRLQTPGMALALGSSAELEGIPAFPIAGTNVLFLSVSPRPSLAPSPTR